MKGTRFSGDRDSLIAIEGVEISAFVDGAVQPLKRIQLLPMGEARIRDGRRLKVTREDLSRVLAEFEEQKNDVAFLYQHGDDPKHGWEAGGWIKDLESGPDGLFALVQWLPDLAADIKAGRYKYASPNIKFRKDEDGFMRPLYLLEGSVTNVPAVDGMDQLAASAMPSFQPTTPTTLHMMKCAACGREFKGTHQDGCTALCNSPNKSKLSDEGIENEKEKTMANETETGAALKSLEEKIAKLTESFGKFTEANADTKALTDRLVAEILPTIKEEARKDAAAQLAESHKAEKFDGILTAAEKDGQLTSAQRAAFAGVANGDPEKAAAFVATLPKPDKSKLVTAGPDPKLSVKDGEGKDTTDRAARLTQIARFAADNAMSMVEADEFLTQKENADAAKIAAAAAAKK